MFRLSSVYVISIMKYLMHSVNLNGHCQKKGLKQ